MMRLNAGNVLLKPSQQRHLLSSLRRTQRIGQRLGNFILTIDLQRQGRHYDLRADVSDRIGTFQCRARARDWRGALKRLVRRIGNGLHEQCLRQQLAA